MALGLPGHPPKGVVPRYPPTGVLRDWSRPVPGSCRGVVSPLTGGFPHNPEMLARLSHVLKFASIPFTSIQGHYREARRDLRQHLHELTGPGMPLEGILPRIPVELTPPLP